MKTQMIIGGILFGVAACTAPADGYRITGNIEGAGDGKAILLQSAGFGEPRYGEYAEWKIRVRRAFGIPGFRHCKGVS